MKTLGTILITLVLVAILGGTGWFLYSKSKTKPVHHDTETATVTDIVKKTVATGSIVPRQEVELKPRVSGVLYELLVEPGATVKKGDAIGKIQIVPDAAQLNRAEGDIRAAQISQADAQRELDRAEKLLAEGLVAESEVAKARTAYDLRKQATSAAQSNYQIVKEGQLRGTKASSNAVVVSTVDGMVIDVPVKVGYSVIESNNFNAGTTIAVIADMGDMIFDGNVDESEVGKVKEGLPLKIKIGALDTEQFDGTLEYIAPKGKLVDGSIQFEIKAALAHKEGVFIRAGYSANADVVLAEKKQVLAVREAVVQYDNGDKTKPYVQVETRPGIFERRDVQLGLSDGISAEVVKGVTASDKIMIPDNAGPGGAPPAMRMPGRGH